MVLIFWKVETKNVFSLCDESWNNGALKLQRGQANESTELVLIDVFCTLDSNELCIFNTRKVVFGEADTVLGNMTLNLPRAKVLLLLCFLWLEWFRLTCVKFIHRFWAIRAFICHYIHERWASVEEHLHLLRRWSHVNITYILLIVDIFKFNEGTWLTIELEELGIFWPSLYDLGHLLVALISDWLNNRDKSHNDQNDLFHFRR